MTAANEITHYSGTPGPGAIGAITIHNLSGPDAELTAPGKYADDGFTWGYAGSGPKETAYALLVSHTGADPTRSILHAFVDEFVSAWPEGRPWAITPLTIERFIQHHSKR